MPQALPVSVCTWIEFIYAVGVRGGNDFTIDRMLSCSFVFIYCNLQHYGKLKENEICVSNNNIIIH